jgi:hypothetical protein
MLVRIIDPQPVRYSLDNGITVTEYAPGGIFDVPEFAALNMVKRGWAREVRAEDLDRLDDDNDAQAQSIDVKLSELRTKTKEPKS